MEEEDYEDNLIYLKPFDVDDYVTNVINMIKNIESLSYDRATIDDSDDDSSTGIGIYKTIVLFCQGECVGTGSIWISSQDN